MASYGTFFKQQAPVYRSAQEALVARARRKLDRRLVLPLEESSWLRAIEVVQAPFTRRGVTPEHWTRVIAGALGSLRPASDASGRGACSSSGGDGFCTTNAQGAQVLDLVLEKVIAREIEWDAQLMRSLTAGFCAHGRLLEALDVAAFAARFVAGIPQAKRGLVESGLLRSAGDGRRHRKRGRWANVVGRAHRRGVGGSEAAAVVGATGYLLPSQSATIPFASVLQLAAIILDACGSAAPLPSVRGARSVAGPTSSERAHALTETEAVVRECIASIEDARERVDAERMWETLHRSPRVRAAAAEVHARCGQWQFALAPLRCASAATAGSPLDAPRARGAADWDANSSTVDEALDRAVALSMQRTRGTRSPRDPSQESAAAAAAADADAHSAPAPARSSSVRIDFEALSLHAVAEIGIAAGAAGAWDVALRCLRRAGLEPDARLELTRAALNALGAAERWVDALALYTQEQPLGAACDEGGAWGSAVRCDTLCSDLAFMAIPRSAPNVTIDLFDHLSATEDDFEIAPLVGTSVCRALLDSGDQWERALAVLANSDAITRAPLVKVRDGGVSPAAALVFELHAKSTHAQLATVLRYPFLFPKEFFDGLPPPGDIAKDPDEALRLLSLKRASSNNRERSLAQRQHQQLADEVLLQRAQKNALQGSAVRPGRAHYFRNAASRRYFDPDYVAIDVAAVEAGKQQPLPVADPASTPRAAPRDYNDTASGWNYYGAFGGLKIFENSRRIATPLSSWPKVMRSLRNPYRGWDVKLNSSHAHRHAVKSWKPDRPL